MKALALFSGGLDSLLAIKLIQKQGIKVVTINFTSPFFSSKIAEKSAKENKIKLKIIKLRKDYINLVKKPKHGYGSGINPCIDCKIFMLKKAKEYAKKINAKFIFTGEVLGERPMSQNLKALNLIEKESGLEGKLLRPLSAKLLKETEAEKKGYVDRNKLLDIQGRGRKKQIELTKKYKIKFYPTPAGGCILTDKEYTKKLRDFFRHKLDFKDIGLLRYGRHFRYDKSKIIVGRNEEENKRLLKLKNKTDYVLEVPDCGSPITLLQGKKTKKSIEIAAKLTAYYSDNKNKKIKVNYNKKSIIIKQITKKEIDKFRI